MTVPELLTAIRTYSAPLLLHAQEARLQASWLDATRLMMVVCMWGTKQLCSMHRACSLHHCAQVV